MKLNLYTLLSDPDLMCPPNTQRVEVTFEAKWLANAGFHNAISNVVVALEHDSWRVQMVPQYTFYTMVITR